LSASQFIAALNQLKHDNISAAVAATRQQPRAVSATAAAAAAVEPAFTVEDADDDKLRM
jgi:hypothetical protein